MQPHLAAQLTFTMAEHRIDLATWPHADQFRLFRGYAKPHFAITSRLDLTHVMTRKADGVSPYRACLFAIAQGLHADPAFLTRLRGDEVWRHDRIGLSASVPRPDGSFGYSYIETLTEFGAFDAVARARIAEAAARTDMGANTGPKDDVAYVSCVPWIDYTSLDNAMPGPDDSIPRVGWGKIVAKGAGFDMAMTIEVHHAVVGGAAMGVFFHAVQDALNSL